MLGNTGDGQLRLVLQYLTDQASKEQVVKDAQDLGQQVGRATAASLNDPAVIAAMQKSYPASFADVPAAAGAAGTQAGTKFREGFSQSGLDQIFGNFQTSMQGVNSGLDQATQKTENWYSQLRMVTREDQMIENLLSTIGTTLAITGVAMEAGIWGSAAKYVATATQANAITDTWKNTTNDLAAQTNRIGEVMANAVLPQYKEMAFLEGKLADFLQAHPEVAAGANLVGELLVGTGAILKAVSTGIRLVSDVMFIEAMHEHSGAMAGVFAPAVGVFKGSVDQFGAETGMQRIGFEPLPKAPVGGMAGALGTIGTVTLLATSVIIGAELGLTLGNAIAKSMQGENYQPQNIQDAFITFSKIFQLPWIGLAQLIGNLDPKLASAANGFITFENNIDSFVGKLIGASRYPSDPASSDPYKLTAQQQQTFTDVVVKDYENFYKTEQTDAQNNIDAISKIHQEANKSEQQAATSNAKAVASINDNYATLLSNQAANQLLQDKAALDNYQAQRATTVRDGNLKIVDEEASLKKKLADLEESHSNKIWDLVAKRDALGIVRENQSYDQTLSKDIRDANDIIAKDKRDTAIRLQDEANAFNRSQEQKHAQEALQYQQEAAAHAKQLATQQQSYDDQLKTIQDNEAQKLQAQKDAYQKQETALRTNLISQINDEYWALNSEAKMKSAYYQQSLAGAEAFMKQYVAALDPGAHLSVSGIHGTIGIGVGVHDYSGYAYPGTYAMAQNGKPEFVLSGQATSAAEQIIGGRLTEQALMSRLLTGNSNSVTWNDMRKFNGEVSVPTRRQLQKDALETLGRILK